MAGPLDGLRVIDMGALIAAPLAAGMLADQGADVIKVEPPGLGDRFRYVGSSRGGMSGLFHLLNRGKRSIALDLTSEAGREVLLRLVRGADVLVQNLRPGVVERLGIAYDDLREVRPQLIYASLSGFGREGPYAGRSVYDNVIQTYSGIADAQKDPASGEPSFVRMLLVDKLTAVLAAQAISSALVARERGAGGQHVELAMLHAGIAFLWPDACADLILQGEGIAEQPGLGGNFDLMRLADGWGTATPFGDAEFQGMCRALDAPEVAEDPRMATVAARMASGDHFTHVLHEVLGKRASKLTREEFAQRFSENGVPFGVVTGREAVHRDPHVQAAGIFAESEHPIAGPLREPTPAAQFRGTPGALPTPAPGLGEHTDELLHELGMGARIEALREAGTVA